MEPASFWMFNSIALSYYLFHSGYCLLTQFSQVVGGAQLFQIRNGTLHAELHKRAFENYDLYPVNFLL
jgi:hypothetical protein